MATIHQTARCHISGDIFKVIATITQILTEWSFVTPEIVVVIVVSWYGISEDRGGDDTVSSRNSSGNSSSSIKYL
jgi:hypothetical protein